MSQRRERGLTRAWRPHPCGGLGIEQTGANVGRRSRLIRWSSNGIRRRCWRSCHAHDTFGAILPKGATVTDLMGSAVGKLRVNVTAVVRLA